MVLPTEIKIKQEINDLDSNSNDDKIPNECPTPEYDIKLEIEVSGTHLSLENDWIKSEVFDTEYDICEDDDNKTISYEELIDYCEQRCSFCSQKFCESYSLLQHNLKHLKLQIEPVDLQNNNCKICNQHFVNRSLFSQHKKYSHCMQSEEATSSEEKFKVTKMLHQCKICGKIQNYKNWYSHMKEVHGGQKYICSLCDGVFKCRRYLRNHMKNVHRIMRGTENVSVSCPQCPAKLKSKDSLKTHIRNCHSEKVQCGICASVLKCKSYLCAHMRRVHYIDGKDHKCDCGKTFRSSRYLKIHIKNVHSRK